MLNCHNQRIHSTGHFYNYEIQLSQVVFCLAGGILSFSLEKNFLLNCFILFCSIGIFHQNMLAYQPNASPQTKSFNQATSQLPLRFQNIGQKQGLEQKEIACIIQDRQGFLWLGASDGLVRYDGYRFRTFKQQPTSLFTNN